MPVLDMPLKELRAYRGSSPCPADFDAFWDASLAKLEAIDPEAVYTPDPFPSRATELYDLTFRSVGGARIHAKVALPKARAGKCPVLLHFHGLGGACMSRTELIAYAAEGYCIASMDVRGQGGLSEDNGSYVGTTDIIPFLRGIEGDPADMLYTKIFLDTAMLFRVITAREDADPQRVGTFGGSQGGALSLVCASLCPSVKLTAACYPYLSDYRRVWDMDLDKAAYDGLYFYFRKFDPRHEREEELFTKLGYIDIQNLAPRIRATVRMYTGLLDNICPPSTQFAVYNKITSPKEQIIYPDYGHELLREENDLTLAFFAENL